MRSRPFVASFAGLAGLVATLGCASGGSTPAAEPPYRSIAYRIDGQPVRLTNGVAEREAAPGSSTRIVTRWLGHELRKDLDGDGREDVAFLLTRDGGGSGTHYYVAAAVDTNGGWAGSDAVRLGDRIAPQAITSGPGRSIVVAWTDRRPGEPMTAPPTVNRSRQLLLDPRTRRFGEVAPGFAGEADPARMTLAMQPWRWVDRRAADGTTVVPAKADRFTLTLSADGTFAATTDCNGVRGRYSAERDGAIAFDGAMASTKMFCEGSQEGAFVALLRQARRYRFTGQGQLVLELEGGGAATFR